MALFSSLSERLNHIFSKLTKRGKLTELEIRGAMREVRVALLEADVNLKVAKEFIAEVSEKAVGQEILKSLNPAQQVIKIVNDELIALMGGKNAKIEVAPKPPTVIMMCGLQGAGKTTLCGKLAYLLKKQGKKTASRCGRYLPPRRNFSAAGRRQKSGLRSVRKRHAVARKNGEAGNRIREVYGV